MWNKVARFTFRKPAGDEFGSKFLADKVLYFDISLEPRPLDWLLTEHNRTGLIWCSEVNLTPFNKFVRPLEIIGSDFIKDGSTEFDDIEIPFASVNSLIGNDNRIVEYSMFSQLVSAACDTKASASKKRIIITTRVDKKSFIDEIKEYARINNKVEFDHAVQWLAELRNGKKASFNSIRDIIAPLVGDESIRSGTQIEIKMQRFWVSISSNKAFVKLKDALPILSDEEIVKYFLAKHADSMHVFDERDVLRICSDPPKELAPDIALYFGRTKKNSIGRAFAIVNRAMTKNGTNCSIVGKLDTVTGFSEFKLSNVSDLKMGGNNLSKTVKIDKDLGIKVCNKVQELIGKDNFSVPGRVAGIKMGRIQELMEAVTSDVLSADLANINSSIELVPLADGVSEISWASALSVAVPISIKREAAVTIVTYNGKLPELNLNKLSELDEAIANIAEFSHEKSVNAPKANLSKEGRQHVAAVRLASIYNVLSDVINFHWYVTMGCPKIQRPFIIANNELNQTLVDPLDKAIFDMVQHADFVTARGAVHSVFPRGGYEVFEAILTLKGLCKDWDECRTLAATSLANKMGRHSTIDVLTDAIHAKDSKIKMDTILKKKDKPVKYKFNSDKGTVLIDPTYLDAFGIYHLFLHTCINLMSENDVFLNTAGNAKALMTPESVIESALRDNTFSKFTLQRSIYA